MDPLTGAIVGAIVFFLIREAVAVALVVFGFVIAAGLGKIWPVVVGFLVAGLWEIFCVFWIIENIARIVAVASGHGG